MTTRIVLIDNNVATRAILNVRLAGQGWQVYEYSYVQLDRSALEELQPDLIILDLNTQDNGVGWELLQSIKMTDATAAIPILITATVIDLSAEMRAYLLTRYIHVLYRPIDFDVLLPLIRKTLRLATQADSLFSSKHVLPILVVEDTEDLRDALTTMLQLEGYQVVEVENGLLALDAVYHADHCLILLDMQMPVMDGLEFLKMYDQQLRPHSPVVVLSANEDTLAENFPAFVIDVIAKPYKLARLLPVVRKYALLA